ncbi:hypothetical protein [uncultured Methanospirillum sp.]|uniref:hypothetical protein n=1 Tax=uncultured Methanospirillum sp. TaxID=262503 RepID=UPI0029C7B297|nr:hypothetical protein [uncultured Methanospirillum sp.]
MTWEIVSGFLGGTTIVNVIGLILMYRQYMKLAASSMDFAALVVESIEEKEDGTVTVDPLALVATSFVFTVVVDTVLNGRMEKFSRAPF